MKTLRVQVATAAKGDKFAVEDRIASNWDEKGKQSPGEWYLATIVHVSSAGNCAIAYDSMDKDTYPKDYMESAAIVKLPKVAKSRDSFTFQELKSLPLAVAPKPGKETIDHGLDASDTKVLTEAQACSALRDLFGSNFLGLHVDVARKIMYGYVISMKSTPKSATWQDDVRAVLSQMSRPAYGCTERGEVGKNGAEVWYFTADRSAASYPEGMRGNPSSYAALQRAKMY